LSSFVNNHFPIPNNRSIKADDIVTTPGVYAALEQVSYAVADPGDGILIGRPMYNGFQKGFTFSRSRLVAIAGRHVDPFTKDAVERYRNVMESSNEDGTKIKAILLCNPHNPLGRCFSTEVLEEYVKFCCENGIHLICDEIYAMTHYEKKEGLGVKRDVSFVSVLSLPKVHKDQDKMVHSLYGMSKDFCCSGVRLGAVITRAEEIKKVIMTNSFLSWVSSGADIIWSCILADSGFVTKFFNDNQFRLTNAYQFLTEKLECHRINYYKEGRVSLNAGLFVWIDLSYALQTPVPEHATDGDRERYISDRLMKAPGGLKLSAGRTFKTEKLGWFRCA
ncbi:pyridoxal phosphate-dependent transferase, partial [Trichophaea hybrida]